MYGYPEIRGTEEEKIETQERSIAGIQNRKGTCKGSTHNGTVVER
jgi:hypothetical protein